MTDLSLSLRDGLPDDLKVLLRDLPRADWPGHPGFAGLVQFWLDRHGMFRQLLDLLQTDQRALADRKIDAKAYAPRLSRFGSTLLGELHGHHQIEDQHYFPRLARFDARLQRGFDLLDADHHAMDAALHDLAEGANAVLRGGPVGAFGDRLDAFARLLDRHLTDEEDLIVPVILRSGFRG